jgi:hypothetical protein
MFDTQDGRFWHIVAAVKVLYFQVVLCIHSLQRSARGFDFSKRLGGWWGFGMSRDISMHSASELFVDSRRK